MPRLSPKGAPSIENIWSVDLSADNLQGLVLGSEAYTGNLDELRITSGILAPDAMMSCSDLGGFILVYK